MLVNVPVQKLGELGKVFFTVQVSSGPMCVPLAPNANAAHYPKRDVILKKKKLKDHWLRQEKNFNDIWWVKSQKNVIYD